MHDVRSSAVKGFSQCVKPKTTRDHIPLNNVPEPITDVETLYAKPDMSRKTNKTVGVTNQFFTTGPELIDPLSDLVPVTPSEDAYDDLRNPEEDPCPSIPLLTSGSLDNPSIQTDDHIYSTTNHTAESSTADDFYLTSSAHPFF